MKRPTLLLALTCALLPLSGAMAQTTLTSSTLVIGFYKFEAPAGFSAWGCGLVTKKVYQGVATSATAGAPSSGEPTSVITVAGASFLSYPLHYLEILSAGSEEGRNLDIISTTPTTIRVKGIATGTPAFCVRKHNTVGSVFAGGAGIVPFDDSVTIYNSDGSSTIVQWDGVDWSPTGDVIIYPGQGFLLSKAAPGIITIGGGEVAYIKSNVTKVNVYANAEFNLISPVNPLVPANASDPIITGIGRKTPTEFGLGSLLTPFDDFAFRLDKVGGFETVAVYQFDGLSVNETTGVPAASDFFRVGEAVVIQSATDSERTLQPTFAQ